MRSGWKKKLWLVKAGRYGLTKKKVDRKPMK